MTPVRTVARTLLASIFVTEGLSSLIWPERLADTWPGPRRAPTPARPERTPDPAAERPGPETAPHQPPERAAVGWSTDPRDLVRLNGAAQVLGAIMLATDPLTRPGALLLAGTLVPAAVAENRDRDPDDPDDRADQRVHLTKNAALLGGLLLAAVDTRGRPGLGWRATHLAEHALASLSRVTGSAAREARVATREARVASRQARIAAREAGREVRRAAGQKATASRRAGQKVFSGRGGAGKVAKMTTKIK